MDAMDATDATDMMEEIRRLREDNEQLRNLISYLRDDIKRMTDREFLCAQVEAKYKITHDYKVNYEFSEIPTVEKDAYHQLDWTCYNRRGFCDYPGCTRTDKTHLCSMCDAITCILHANYGKCLFCYKK